MSSGVDNLGRPKARLRRITFANLLIDLGHLMRGVLDWRSLLNGYRALDDPAEVVVRRPDGTIKQIARSHNLRTNAGGDAQAGVMGNAAGNPAIYMALSADTNRPMVTDTSLAGELTAYGLARIAAAYSHTPVSGTGPTTISGSYSLTGQWTYSNAAPGAQLIVKVGVFDAAVGGVMWFEFKLPTTMSVSPGDAVEVIYTVLY